MKKIILVLCCGLFLSAEREASAQTATFNYTGSLQTWTVPCGVTTITVSLNGASGGFGGNATLWDAGGLGGVVSGTYNTVGGTTLNIYVGGVGQNEQVSALGLGGYNGGGNGGDDANTWLGGGGGGATDIRVGGLALANRIAVAGGGGGDNSNTTNQEVGGPGGSTSPANGAGSYNGVQNSNTSYCGQGATVATFGAGATSCVGSVAALGVGGNSCTSTSGGGGGGGYYGGGCGCYAGGGGGSSYTGGLSSILSNTMGTAPVGNGKVVITWVVPTAVSVSGNIIKNVLCNGGSTGQASGIVTGGGVPFTYSWTPSGGTKDTASGLSAGSYTVNVTDNCGTTASATVTITQPNALSVAANTVTNVTCNAGSNGSTGSTVSGGVGPYTYAWTPSGGTNSTASSLSTNTYTLTVTDNNGCSGTASATVTQPNVLGITANVTANELCNGGSNGSASTITSGGTSAFTYAWTPAGGSTDTAVGLTAGSYTITVSDACGGSATAGITITEPTALSVAVNTTANVSCHGDSNGSASSTVSGGTMPYTYAWTPSGGSTDTAVGLISGSYTLTVTDNNGCSGTATTTITQPTAIAIVKHTTPDNGSNNGTASVTVSGGTGPYTYMWSPGGNTTDSISGKATGTYCCSVKDANGCADSVCIHIKSTAGISSIASEGGQIIVYPNPNNGQFTIKSVVDGGASTVEIYNVLGERVYTASLNTNKGGNNTINISSQPNGIYLYRVITVTGNLLGEGKITLQK